MAEEANDLEILHPERTATVADREVTVREFGFVEGLKVEARARPIIDAVAEAETVTEGMFSALAEHPELTTELIAQAADQPVEWVQSLGDEDGQALLMLFIGANAGFFARRLWRRRQLATAPDSPTSTPDSSAPDSDDAPPRSDA